MKSNVWTKSNESRRHFIGGSDARTIMGDDEAALLRSAYRYGIVPNFGGNSGLGFRIVAVVRSQ